MIGIGAGEQGGGDKVVGGSKVVGDGDVIDLRDAEQGLHIRVVGLFAATGESLGIIKGVV